MMKKKRSTTMTFDEFKDIPLAGPTRQPLTDRIKQQLQYGIDPDRLEFYDNQSLDQRSGTEASDLDGYSLCLGTEGLKPVKMYAPTPEGVEFSRNNSFDSKFCEQHSDFYRRGDESNSAMQERLEKFFDDGGVMYSAEYEGNTLGSLGVFEKNMLLVMFSYYVLPEWRGKGGGKALLKYVLDDITSNGYELCFFKTKNKFVYYFLTKCLDAKTLWKELYLKHEQPSMMIDHPSNSSE